MELIIVSLSVGILGVVGGILAKILYSKFSRIEDEIDYINNNVVYRKDCLAQSGRNADKLDIVCAKVDRMRKEFKEDMRYLRDDIKDLDETSRENSENLAKLEETLNCIINFSDD